MRMEGRKNFMQPTLMVKGSVATDQSGVNLGKMGDFALEAPPPGSQKTNPVCGKRGQVQKFPGMDAKEHFIYSEG